MTPIRPLADGVFVSNQIAPEDMPALKARGIAAVVSHRPDGEEAGQPEAYQLAAAAEAAGLGWTWLPVVGLPDGETAEATMAAVEAADGPTLMFCRSGTRSAAAWSLARAARGDDPGALVDAAARAGVDLRPLLPRLRSAAGAP